MPKLRPQIDPSKPRHVPKPKSWHAEARQLREQGVSLDELAIKYGVTAQWVSDVCRGIAGPPNTEPETVNGLPNWQSLNGEARLEIITPMWQAGKSAMEIAMCFSNASRNAIVSAIRRGKITGPNSKSSAIRTRMLMVRRENAGKPKPPKTKTVRKPVAAKPPLIERLPEPDLPPSRVQQMIDGNRPPLPGCAPVPLIELPNRPGVMCRFPVEGGYCGAGCGDAMYCDTHQAIMYRPANKIQVPKEARL